MQGSVGVVVCPPAVRIFVHFELQKSFILKMDRRRILQALVWDFETLRHSHLLQMKVSESTNRQCHGSARLLDYRLRRGW